MFKKFFVAIFLGALTVANVTLNFSAAEAANQTVWVKIETPDTGAFSREDDGVKAGQVYIMPVTIVVISLGAIAGYRIYKKRNCGWK